jgi:protein-S-isoprenylcysteine O-methyltransferase Ste14
MSRLNPTNAASSHPSGVVRTAWAVSAAGDVDLSRPSQLVAAGPYRFCGNPMYIAWTVLYIATAILVNTRWSRPAAERMLILRAAVLSGTFDQLWADAQN